tara:strand:+ start:10364 stop:11629 length:1266 start_codon:yes stop_codon:yes gene_type:complete
MTLVFSISWIADELNLLPHFFTWSIEVLIVTLFSIFLLPKIVFLREIKITPIGKYFIFLVLYGILGSIIYAINFSSILMGLRSFFKYGFLFLIFINSNISQHMYRKLFKYWMLILAIQPIIGLYQYFVEKKVGDSVHGSFTDTGMLGMLLIIFIICLIDLINMKIMNNYILYFLIFLSMTVVPILGEVKAFFYILPIIFFIRYFESIRLIRLKNAILITIPFVISVYLFQNFFDGVNVFDFTSINISNFTFRQGVESLNLLGDNDANTVAISLSERFLSLLATFNFLTNDFSRIFFGDGLGSHIFTYESRAVFSLFSTEEYLMKFSLARFITNMGAIGLLIFYYMLIRFSYYAYKSSQFIDDQFFISIYKIIPAFSVLFCISMIYTEPFEEYISFSYWFFISSLMYVPELRAKNKVNYFHE